MYDWRRMTDAQRAEVLASRRMSGRPLHSPPHRADFGSRDYLITAACFEHRGIIGATPERLDEFCAELLTALAGTCAATHAWCVLPNHYHVLVDTENVLRALHVLGRLHGRMSHVWNGQDRTRGRRVFFRATERAIRSESHWHAAMNYVHHNAVRHDYVARSTDWPWCSASEFVERVGREEAARLWREYPVMNFGGGWDDASM